MDFYRKTTLGLFDSSQKSFIIPVYQRAYSWEKEQWNTFLKDLLEQIEGQNNYFFGNILLETLKKDTKYEIIDGQQRITTLTVFIRALLNVLLNRKNEDLLKEFDFQTKESIFLKNGGNIKLRPVEYDRACYDAVIIDNKDNFESNTLSQDRIKKSKKFFENELDKLSTEKVLRVLEKIETTDLTIIELEGKKDSALMFELENNRGKDLTNMEKIKSYFMYQMYVYSDPEEVESNIENVSNIFKLIYLMINDLKKLNEDSVLIYHNNAYIKGYNYRTLEDLKEVFKKSNNKIEWIKGYITELHTSFSNMKKFENSKDYYSLKLEELNAPAYVYPFIIKGYKFFGDDDRKLNTLFNLLEVLTFRAKLINSRANIQERLNSILLSFKGNLTSLILNVKNKLNETWYWGDSNVKSYLNGAMYGNKVLNYLLWQYENSIQNKGYSIKKFSLENEQVEHISPQTPTNGEPLETGYEVDENNEYSEDFKTNIVNSLGNLMLISGSHNASIGNKPFSDKVRSYNQNPLLNQQAEIKDYAINENEHFVWKSKSILKRHKCILEFATNLWSFENINLEHLKDETENLKLNHISNTENKTVEENNLKSKSSNKLVIKLNPQLESEFKELLLKRKQAYITIYYENGTLEQRTWKANSFKESSGVMGNLRSRPEFRNGKWQENGIEKVYVSIEKNE
ncbi:DUF262 domain-containing protein [Tenacibaculum sp. M341]|uniref:DUF262 domain-containing protein n=1 Tax=Tenacibaculum sp. M341 TaxID=2530339 RepID=UPI001051F9AD|nr:DUF262 domain-containing protein [Tenacibaculum sp. M341]TCI93638.1 DUF262 domain-containing protein [Tenacibaculum sp. M341]